MLRAVGVVVAAMLVALVASRLSPLTPGEVQAVVSLSLLGTAVSLAGWAIGRWRSSRQLQSVAPGELASGRVDALAVAMPLVALPWLIGTVWLAVRRQWCPDSTRLSLVAVTAFFALPIGVAVDRLPIGYWVAFTAVVLAADTCATLARGDEPHDADGPRPRKTG